MASVGTHIKRLRTARRLTQEALAEKLFVTRQAVSARETACRMWRPWSTSRRPWTQR